jgi:hypothetical protein
MDCVSAETDDLKWGICLIPDLASRELGKIPY